MAAASVTLILAHQGGWDEILFVLAPLLVFGGLLALARHRVDQIDQDEDRTHPVADQPEGADQT